MSQRLERLAPFLIAGLFALFFVVDTVRTQPVLQDENYRHFRYYGLDRGQGLSGELTKIFDVCILDDCFYRGRPVNYLLELIDVKFMVAANAWGGWGFHSIVRLLLVLGACIFLGRAASALGAPPGVAVALGAFFAVTGQALASSAVDGRPAKLWAAFSTAVLFDAWVRIKKWRSTTWLAYTAFACLAVMGDEQVLIMMAMICALAVLRREGRPFLALVGVALVVYFSFRSTIGLWATQHYTNGPVDLKWSDPSSFVMLDGPLFDLAAHVWLFQFGMTFGSFSDASWVWVPLIFGLPAGLVYLRSREKGRGGGWEWLPLLGLLPMTYLLGARHHPILGHDLRRLLYFLPTAMVMLAVVVLVAHRWQLLTRRGPRALLLATLLVMGTSSFVAQERTKFKALESYMSYFVQENRVIWKLLQEPTLPIPEMWKGGKEFVEYARTWIKPNGV